MIGLKKTCQSEFLSTSMDKNTGKTYSQVCVLSISSRIRRLSSSILGISSCSSVFQIVASDPVAGSGEKWHHAEKSSVSEFVCSSDNDSDEDGDGGRVLLSPFADIVASKGTSSDERRVERNNISKRRLTTGETRCHYC